MDKIKKTRDSNKGDSSAGSGELHQTAESAHPELTTNQGVPISDNQNSLKVNPRGPILGEDFMLHDGCFLFQ